MYSDNKTKKITDKEWNEFLELPNKEEKATMPFPDDSDDSIRDIEYER